MLFNDIFNDNYDDIAHGWYYNVVDRDVIIPTYDFKYFMSLQRCF